MRSCEAGSCSAGSLGLTSKRVTSGENDTAGLQDYGEAMAGPACTSLAGGSEGRPRAGFEACHLHTAPDVRGQREKGKGEHVTTAL